MIEIKNDKIFTDGIEKDIDKINVVSLSRNFLSFSSKIADCANYEKDIESFYKDLIKGGRKGFLLVENNIVNLNNIDSMYISFYQYAGISIHKSSQENADLCLLTLACKDNKKESIPFRTFKEAEKCYHEIDMALTKLRNEEAANRLLNA